MKAGQKEALLAANVRLQDARAGLYLALVATANQLESLAELRALMYCMQQVDDVSEALEFLDLHIKAL
jgi:uncharacterized lipoprotein YajG